MTSLNHGDIPVVCTTSGVVVLFSAIILPHPDEGKGGQNSYQLWREEIVKGGGNWFFRGKVCVGCRSTPSTMTSMTRESTCQYRALRGPLFVPR